MRSRQGHVAIAICLAGAACLAHGEGRDQSPHFYRGELFPSPFYEIPEHARSLTQGDFNGDGVLDIAVLTAQVRAVKIFLNQGGGRFSEAAVVPVLTPDSPSDISAGDLNRDGLDDLVVTHTPFGHSVLRNIGGLNFAQVIYIDGQSALTHFGAIADYTGDQWPDFISFTGVGAYCYANDGAGNLEPPTEYWGAFVSLSRPQLHDMDGDGDLDAAWASGLLALWRNQGGVFSNVEWTTLSPPPSVMPTFDMGDFDGDGDVDLIMAEGLHYGRFRVAINDGSGGSSSVTNTTLPSFRLGSIVAGDWDRNGVCDAGFIDGLANRLNTAEINADNEVVPLAWQTVNFPSRLFRGDFDGDGADDCAVTSGTSLSGFSLNFGRRGRGLGLVQQFPNAASVVAANLDGDQYPEILTIEEAGLVVRRRIGIDQYQVVSTKAEYATGVLEAFDFNRDGIDEVLHSFEQSSSMRVLYVDGQGELTEGPVSPVSIAGNLSPLEISDVDGDGDFDVLSNGFGAAQICLNNGAQVFSPGPFFAFGRGSFADMDGDGDTDIVVSVGSSGTSSVAIWTNDGSGQFVSGESIHMSGNAWPKAVDVDSDGDIDVLQVTSMLRNDGVAGWTEVQYPPAGFYYYPRAVADLNGDQRPDFLGNSDRGVVVRLATPDGGLGAVQLYSPVGMVATVRAADLDADGNPDLMAAATAGYGFASSLRTGVYMNRRPPRNIQADMNCDGVISVGDIAPFIAALTDPAAFRANWPECRIENGDTDGNGVVSVGDIGSFVSLVAGG